MGDSDLKDMDEKVPAWRSCRYAFSVLAFFSSFFIFLLRINFSVAIVCMTYDDVTNSSHPNSSVAPAPVETSLFGSFLQLPRSSLADEECPGRVEDALDQSGDFPWDRQLRGTLSSSFFWGYILTLVPGGWLAQRFSGKHLVNLSMAMSAVATLLCPPAAWISPYALAAMRVLNGLFQGLYFPAIFSLCAAWFPLKDRSLLLAIWISGTEVGSMVSLGLSGYLCTDLGWQWLFYMYGLPTAAFVVVWHLTVYDSPAQHPRITAAERRLIEGTAQTTAARREVPIPWLSVLTSPAVWALIVYDFGLTWALYMGLTQLPQYMQDVLKVNITQNGVYNAVPHLAKLVFGFLFAALGDYIVRLGRFRVITVRKALHTVGCLLPMCFIVGVGYLDCNAVPLAIGLLTLQDLFASANKGGAAVARVDFAPSLSGVINGICYTSANIPGIVVPIITGLITKDGTRQQWQLVFYLSGVAYFIGWLSFFVLGTSEVQEWAKLPQEDTAEKDPEKCSSGEKVNPAYVESKSDLTSVDHKHSHNLTSTYL